MPGKLDMVRVKRAAKIIANGGTLQQAADAVGRSRDIVKRWRSRDDVADLIRRETERVLDRLPDAVSMLGESIDAGRQAIAEQAGLTDDPKARLAATAVAKLGVDAASKIAQAAGVLPSHSAPPAITIISGSNDDISPIIATLLGKALGNTSGILGEKTVSSAIPDDDYIDVTPE